jgi:hypothetical protein
VSYVSSPKFQEEWNVLGIQHFNALSGGDSDNSKKS